MNKGEMQKLYEIIEYELYKIKNNEAYINGKSYFGLSYELLSYIRKLEKALNKIEENYCNYYGTTKEQNDNDILRYVLKEILEIIKKAKENE